MSASWKNPFLKEHSKHDEDSTDVSKQKQSYAKVSCEAIPEEMSGMGTTPPDSIQQSLNIAISSKPPPHSVSQQSPVSKKSSSYQKMGGMKRDGLKLETKPNLDKQTCLSMDSGDKIVMKPTLSSGDLGTSFTRMRHDFCHFIFSSLVFFFFFFLN